MEKEQEPAVEEERFFFNGIELPTAGTLWNLVDLGPPVLELPAEDVTIADVWTVACKIDHVGSVESCDGQVFVYAVQEIICRAVAQRDRLSRGLAEEGRLRNSAYADFITCNLEMRQLAIDHGVAFWSMGTAADNERLKEAMRRAQLPHADPAYEAPPHVRKHANYAKFLQGLQIKQLRKALAQKQIDSEVLAQIDRGLRKH